MSALADGCAILLRHAGRSRAARRPAGRGRGRARQPGPAPARGRPAAGGGPAGRVAGAQLGRARPRPRPARRRRAGRAGHRRPAPPPLPAPPPPPPAPQPRAASADQWVLGEVEEPRTTLADVGGMPALKRWLRTAFLSSLRDPQMRRLFGRSLRGGLLMYGPPGCGKTFLARAVAGELQASFLRIDLAHVVDMWLGYSRRSIHEIFHTARARD